MRRNVFCSLWCFLAFSPAAYAQTFPPPTKVATVIPSDFNFPGGVLLRIGIDSMTDRQTCAIEVTSNDVWIDTSGAREALITTGADVDYSRSAFLRIGSAPAFALIVSRETRRILVPEAKAAAVIRALYTRRPIRLRYVEWPGGGLFDEEVAFGDFAAAYDRGVQLCRWPRLRVPAVHPAPTEATAADLTLIVQKYSEGLGGRVQRNWSVRPGEERDARTVLAFTVGRDGAVESVRVIQSSGNRSSDAYCVRALQASSPLPRLPDEYPDASIALRLEFDFRNYSVVRGE